MTGVTETPAAPRPRSPLRTLAIGVGLAATIFLLETLPLLPGPAFLDWLGVGMILVATFFVFLLFAGFGLFYYIPVLLFSPTRRIWAARQSLLCIALVLGVLGGFLGSVPIRRARFAAAAERAVPVIQAIEAHRKATGNLPASLESLVPSQLRGIPSTGMIAYPSFSYATSKGKELFKTYELSIPCPSGGINFDVFVYWPEQGYPDSMYGGGIERIGNWAYVHE